MVKMLVTLALRHYRDPTSWTAITIAVGAALHLSASPELQAAVDGLMAAIVAVLLAAADGRKNPNADPATGRISERVPEPGADAAGTAASPGGAASDVPAGRGAGIREAGANGPIRRIGPDEFHNRDA